VQRKTAIGDAAWTDIAMVNESTYLVALDAATAFLRVVSP